MKNTSLTQDAVLALARQVKLMIFDVDGVLTDGQVHYSETGELFKSFYTQDGYGLQLLAKIGIRCAIITGRQSTIVDKRAQDLGIQYVYQAARNKLATFSTLLHEAQTSAHECGYMGDDWPDLRVMQRVAFASCPAQAHMEIRAISHYITQAKAGYGAVREVCDLIAHAHGHYQTLLLELE